MSIKRIVDQLLSPAQSAQRSRTMSDGINLLKTLGFYPKTVIDIGAATGTHCLYKTFPNSRHILIEPLEEHIPVLNSLKKEYKQVEYFITAVGSKTGEIEINVHSDHLDGSSILNEQASEYDGVKRRISITTLDKLDNVNKFLAPILLKIDTQGYELDILKGADSLMDKCEYIVAETSFFEFYKGQPLIGEVIEFMRKHGFVLYDIFDLGTRPLDHACGQVDLAFVKKNGLFRNSDLYATSDQWQPPRHD